MTAPILISDDLREEIVRRAEDLVAEKTRHLSRMNEANRIDPENQFDILPTLVELTMAKITLRAIQAPTEVWEIINPGEGTFYSPHSPLDYQEAESELIFKIVEVE